MIKVKYFTYFIIDLFKGVLKGQNPMAPKEVIQERAKACDGCPMNSKGVCMACGCFIRYKKQFRDSTCPLDYWRSKSDAVK